MSRFQLLVQIQLVCICAKISPWCGLIDRNIAFTLENYADIPVKVVSNQ